ncbi:hypothetical protein IPZ68_21520 [Streptomyces arenae]|nr:hypothetical protein [Streptomyces arenae]
MVGVPLAGRPAVREDLRPPLGEAARAAPHPLMDTLAQGGWATGVVCCAVLYARRQSYDGAGARR